MVDQNPVVVGCHLDVNHSPDFSVVRRKKDDVVGLRDVKDLELVVRRDVGVATAGAVGMLHAVFEEVALNRNFRRVAGRRSDVLEFRIARTSGNVVQLGRRGNVSVAVQVVIVDEQHVFGLQSVSHEIAVTVIFILNFNHRVDPLSGLTAAVLVGIPVQTHVSQTGNHADGEQGNKSDDNDLVGGPLVVFQSPRLHGGCVVGVLFQAKGVFHSNPDLFYVAPRIALVDEAPYGIPVPRRCFLSARHERRASPLCGHLHGGHQTKWIDPEHVPNHLQRLRCVAQHGRS